MVRNKQIVIFTDLDGTFLDAENYSFEASLPALRLAQQYGVPVVFCSSKTRAEIEILQERCGVHDPFIVENGSAIYFPSDQFSSFLAGSEIEANYPVKKLGTPYAEIVEVFRQLRTETGCKVKGFSNMTAAEIAADCGLSLADALRAKAREYSEPFRFTETNPDKIELLLQHIVEAGYRFSIGGRYHHLHGNADKGSTVRLLCDLYRRTHDNLFTVGLGDSLNDVPMLREVHQPVLVRRRYGSPYPDVVATLPHVRLTKGIGPEGWCEAVLEILEERSN